MTEGEIIALIGMAGMVIVAIIQAVSQSKSKKIIERLDKLEEHGSKQYLSLLRLTIMSNEMPISERIIAGKEYIDRGGNGDIKKFYQEFVKEHTI